MTDTRIVQGEVILPDTDVPSATANVVVQVEDVSRADAPSVVIGEYRKVNVPLHRGAALPFAVQVPADQVDEHKTYSLRVHIDVSGSGEVEVGDLVSTESYPVLTRGHGLTARVRVKTV